METPYSSVDFEEQLEEKNISTRLFCQDALAKLIKETTNIKKVQTQLVSKDNRIRWCPLMSLPHRLA